jgi:hypothetical protein
MKIALPVCYVSSQAMLRNVLARPKSKQSIKRLAHKHFVGGQLNEVNWHTSCVCRVRAAQASTQSDSNDSVLKNDERDSGYRKSQSCVAATA